LRNTTFSGCFVRNADPPPTSKLLVADAAGHILERIGATWKRYAPDMGYELVLSESMSLGACATWAKELGFLHWLDMRRAQRGAGAILCPQMLTIYHHLAGEEAQVQKLVRTCDVVSAGSRLWQQRLEKLTGGKVWLTPQSVDTEWFRPALDRQIKRAEQGLAPDEFVIGFVAKAAANVADRKGIDVLEKVLQGLQLPGPWSVLLVGQGWETLAGKFRRQGIKVTCFVPVNCQATKTAYGWMDVLLVTAREEGGPATVLEAMASGLPCVATAVGHVPEMVHPGENGWLCPVDDVAGLVDGLRSLARSPQLCSSLGLAAREACIRQWDDRVVVPKIDFTAMAQQARANYLRRPAGDLQARAQRFFWYHWRDRVARWVKRK